jgi:hypothetical protein
MQQIYYMNKCLFKRKFDINRFVKPVVIIDINMYIYKTGSDF